MNKSIHGSLVVWKGIGILLVGESGVGKTTCALEIAKHGGVWVADDVVVLSTDKNGLIFGRVHERIRNLAHLRSEGIADVRKFFPPWRIVDEARIDLVVDLARKREKKDYTLGNFRKARELNLNFAAVPVDDDISETLNRIYRNVRRAAGRKEFELCR